MNGRIATRQLSAGTPWSSRITEGEWPYMSRYLGNAGALFLGLLTLGSASAAARGSPAASPAASPAPAGAGAPAAGGSAAGRPARTPAPAAVSTAARAAAI